MPSLRPNAPPKKAAPKADDSPDKGLNLTNDEIQDGADARTDEDVEEIADEVMRGADASIDSLVPPLNDAEKSEVRDLVKSGDRDQLESFLKDRGLDTSAGAGKDLLDRADLIQRAGDIAAAVKAGEGLTPADLRDFSNAVKQLGGANLPDMSKVDMALGEMWGNYGLTRMLNEAQPGDLPVPNGGNVQIAVVPNLSVGTIVPLGDNSVLIGGGDMADQVTLGFGNPAAVAQWYTAGPTTPESVPPANQPAPDAPVALQPPIAADLSQPFAHGVLLRNTAEGTVNYTLEGQAFSMAKGEVHTLPAGKAYSIEFDRGAERGTVRYTLSEGTYDFSCTEAAGWQLNKQTVRIAAKPDASLGRSSVGKAPAPAKGIPDALRPVRDPLAVAEN